MKIKTLNQKSKIALFAVILVALIGLVLSVGSIVHAQEVGQTDPRTSDVGQIDARASETEAVQPTDATQDENATQAADATESAAPAITADSNQQAAPHNDANSLLENDNNLLYNASVKVRVPNQEYIKNGPDGWTKETIDGQEYYTKSYEVGSPVAGVKTAWSQTNIVDGYIFYDVSCDYSNVLLDATTTDFNVNAYQLKAKTLHVNDENGNPIKGVVVKSMSVYNNSVVEHLSTETDDSGKADVKWAEQNFWKCNVSKSGFQTCDYTYLAWMDWSLFEIKDDATITLNQVTPSKNYLELITHQPTYYMMETFDVINGVEFESKLLLEKKRSSSSSYLDIYDETAASRREVRNAQGGSSGSTESSYYFMQDDNTLSKMPDEGTVSISESCRLLCLGTFDGKNLIALPAADKFTFTFKWTIGGTEYVSTTANELYQYIDPNMDFTVKGNMLEGINKTPTNDSMADEVRIIATPISGYEFKNWQQDGVDIEDGATFNMTTNTIFAFTAIGEPTHALTINYKYENGTQAADTHTEQVAEGATYSVESPTIDGYTPDIATVEGTMDTEDITTDVTYKANGGGGGGDTPGGGGTSGVSDSAVTGGTSSSSTGDFNSSAVMAIMGLVALAGGFAIAGRKKLFNR